MKHGIRYAFVLVLSFMLGSNAWAQWSSDPSVNLALANKSDGADQVQPKVKPLPDHGWYVSWFDADPNSPPPVGYSVFLQRLGPAGYQIFKHGGIEVAHLSNSSTEDYGLDVDTAGNALLAFLDTREGSNQQVTAAKMSPEGKALWGQRGVQLTTGSANSNGSPKIAGTSDGGVVVAWISNSNTMLQKLDANGKPQWGNGVVLSKSNYNYWLADLHAADNGSVIVSWVSNQGFGSNNLLLTNKLSATGALMWGANHVTLFDNGSLQFGNFPLFRARWTRRRGFQLVYQLADTAMFRPAHFGGWQRGLCEKRRTGLYEYYAGASRSRSFLPRRHRRSISGLDRRRFQPGAEWDLRAEVRAEGRAALGTNRSGGRAPRLGPGDSPHERTGRIRSAGILDRHGRVRKRIDSSHATDG